MIQFCDQFISTAPTAGPTTKTSFLKVFLSRPLRLATTFNSNAATITATSPPVHPTSSTGLPTEAHLEKVGLGVGLGLGVPILLAAAVSVWFLC